MKVLRWLIWHIWYAGRTISIKNLGKQDSSKQKNTQGLESGVLRFQTQFWNHTNLLCEFKQVLSSPYAMVSFMKIRAFLSLKLWDSKLCKRWTRKLLPELWRGLWSIGTQSKRENQGHHQRHNTGSLLGEHHFVYLLLLTGPYWSLVWSAICSVVYNVAECSPVAGTDQPGEKRRNTLAITWAAKTHWEPTMCLALH